MDIGKILVIMDMEHGDCTGLMGKILDFISLFKAKDVDVLVVLESVKKMEDVAISFGMPFDPNTKEDSVKRIADRLRHMFPKDINANFHIKVGYFDEELENISKELNPDIFLMACDNFKKDLSKFAKSAGKPILLIN